MKPELMVEQEPLRGPLADDFNGPGDGGLTLWWLGQAGFALRAGSLRLLVDPYLSNHLAEKYRNHEFSHVRLMPSPLLPGEARELDWCLCSHAHGDHMDPGTLPALAAGNPRCRFVVPRAETAEALARGIPAGRLVAADAGDWIDLGGADRLQCLPAAHEDVATDAAGHNRYLGFMLHLGGAAIYHSGDCVPFDGLQGWLTRSARPDLALLPVNGRDQERTRRGIIGNFSFEEAAALCLSIGTPWMIAHHYGLFDFNTVAPAELEAKLAASAGPVKIRLARTGVRYAVARTQTAPVEAT